MTIEQPTPPAAPEQPTAPKKQSVVRRIAGVIVGLVVAAGAVYAFNYFSSDAAQTKAGDCASVTGTSSKPEYATVGCDAPEANYVVGKVLGGKGESCGENYDTYTETARRGPDSTLCLMPKLQDGKCHEFSGTGMGYPVIECSASGAVKVSTVAAEADCAEGKVLAYTEPKTIYCLSDPSAQ